MIFNPQLLAVTCLEPPSVTRHLLLIRSQRKKKLQHKVIIEVQANGANQRLKLHVIAVTVIPWYISQTSIILTHFGSFSLYSDLLVQMLKDKWCVIISGTWINLFQESVFQFIKIQRRNIDICFYLLNTLFIVCRIMAVTSEKQPHYRLTMHRIYI